MIDRKQAQVHTEKEKPRPISLEEYRVEQSKIDQQMDCMIAILHELKVYC